MIRLENISKQNGHQILFIEASATLQKGEKVGLVGPNGAGQDDPFPHDHGPGAARRGAGGRRSRRDHRLFQPGRGRDVGPQRGRRSHGRRGSGQRGRGRAEGTRGGHGRPRPRRRDGGDHRTLRRGAGAVRGARRLCAGRARPRGARRPELHARDDGRRRGRAVGRLEDARGAGAHPAHESRRHAARRAEQPSRSGKPDLAGAIPQGLRGRRS